MINVLLISILGRQFEYGTALEIIQDEFYLQESDFNDIKRKDIKKEIKFAIPNIKNDISPDFKDWNNRKKWEPIKDKQKHSKEYIQKNSYSQTNFKKDHQSYNYQRKNEAITLLKSSKSILKHRQKRQGVF